MILFLPFFCPWSSLSLSQLVNFIWFYNFFLCSFFPWIIFYSEHKLSLWCINIFGATSNSWPSPSLSFSPLSPCLHSLTSCFSSLCTICHGYSSPWLLNQHFHVKYSFSLFSSYNLPTLSNTSHSFIFALEHLPLTFTKLYQGISVPRSPLPYFLQSVKLLPLTHLGLSGKVTGKILLLISNIGLKRWLKKRYTGVIKVSGKGGYSFL